ncbi:MAG: UTRA domain-containing protein [Pseudonocardiaceae bacterium]|nr:UTRA domain-containing protein [Pseudonocardiaceae bacterium]
MQARGGESRLPTVSETAPFVCIADDLREAICRGEYGPGHQLPTSSVLMARYGVARQTVQHAFDTLRAEGHVVCRNGAGRFVSDQNGTPHQPPQRGDHGRTATRRAVLTDAGPTGWAPTSRVQIRVEPADARTAETLGVPLGQALLVRERVTSAGDQPIQVAVSRLPRRLTAGTPIEYPDAGPGGVHARLAESGHRVRKSVERVTSRLATRTDADTLRVSPASPMLVITRIAYETSDIPVEVTDMVLAGDRLALVYELPS